MDLGHATPTASEKAKTICGKLPETNETTTKAGELLTEAAADDKLNTETGETYGKDEIGPGSQPDTEEAMKAERDVQTERIGSRRGDTEIKPGTGEPSKAGSTKTQRTRGLLASRAAGGAQHRSKGSSTARRRHRNWIRRSSGALEIKTARLEGPKLALGRK